MLAITLLLLTPPAPAPPDVLLPGHRGIVHELVFEDSPMLADNTLLATPVRGFEGVHVVVPGEPFTFSTKYGTALYLLPEGVEMDHAPRFDDEPPPYPSAQPPVGETRSVPVVSLVRSRLTTCRLVAVEGDALRIEVVDDVRIGVGGKPIGSATHYAIWGGVLTAGVVLCVTVWRRRKRRAAA